ncbi:hypothetical protein H4W34_007354 [Actinomadura algeriensis]|uniref:Uncharacterized protein n=1 Tax=Actinomadura algeriensis TaxID=1679523 RepID=A0ABR9K3U0_9ACTN|nr:hypothetical protein [Actinomadura algeriensis]
MSQGPRGACTFTGPGSAAIPYCVVAAETGVGRSTGRLRVTGAWPVRVGPVAHLLSGTGRRVARTRTAGRGRAPRRHPRDVRENARRPEGSRPPRRDRGLAGAGVRPGSDRRRGTIAGSRGVRRAGGDRTDAEPDRERRGRSGAERAGRSGPAASGTAPPARPRGSAGAAGACGAGGRGRAGCSRADGRDGPVRPRARGVPPRTASAAGVGERRAPGRCAPGTPSAAPEGPRPMPAVRRIPASPRRGPGALPPRDPSVHSLSPTRCVKYPQVMHA